VIGEGSGGKKKVGEAFSCWDGGGGEGFSKFVGERRSEAIDRPKLTQAGGSGCQPSWEGGRFVWNNSRAQKGKGRVHKLDLIKTFRLERGGPRRQRKQLGGSSSLTEKSSKSLDISRGQGEAGPKHRNPKSTN